MYAGLKRLGYTVQRTERFLPTRFRKAMRPEDGVVEGRTSRLDLTVVRNAVGGMLRRISLPFQWIVDGFRRMFASLLGGGGVEDGSLLGKVKATGYGEFKRPSNAPSRLIGSGLQRRAIPKPPNHPLGSYTSLHHLHPLYRGRKNRGRRPIQEPRCQPVPPVLPRLETNHALDAGKVGPRKRRGP